MRVRSRLLLIVVLAWLAIAAMGLSACGGDGRQSPTVDPKSPQGVAEVASFEGVHSGEMGSELVIWNRSSEERVAMRLSAAFQRLGEEVPPELHLALASQGVLA